MVLDDENPPVTSITEKKPPKQKNTKTNSVVKNRKGNSSTEGKQQKNPKGKKTNNKNEGNSSTEGKQQKNPKGKKTKRVRTRALSLRRRTTRTGTAPRRTAVKKT